MGPYARGTSHTTGKVVETFYDNPVLLVVVVLVFAGIVYWLGKKSDSK